MLKFAPDSRTSTFSETFASPSSIVPRPGRASAAVVSPVASIANVTSNARLYSAVRGVSCATGTVLSLSARDGRAGGAVAVASLTSGAATGPARPGSISVWKLNVISSSVSAALAPASISGSALCAAASRAALSGTPIASGAGPATGSAAAVWTAASASGAGSPDSTTISFGANSSSKAAPPMPAASIPAINKSTDRMRIMTSSPLFPASLADLQPAGKLPRLAS